MTGFPILNDLALVVVGSAVLLVGGRRLRVPPILTYMIAGLVLGPLTGLLGASEFLELFSELGIALLLFVVGLELSLKRIREMGAVAAVTAVVQVAVFVALGFAVARMLGFPSEAAVVVGLVAAFSSTVVVVKLLERADDLTAPHGRLAIGILLVQDVLVAVALMLLGTLGGAEGGDLSSLGAGLAVSFFGMAGLIAVGALLARTVLPPFARWISRTPEGFFIVGLAWAFLFILAAEAIHVSVELGAFTAGVVLAQIPYHEELNRRTHPLVDFFLAVFFVSLGARMDFADMGAAWQAALAIAALVLVLKPVLFAVLLGLQGRTRREGILAGLALGQISEFAFILAGLAAAAGIVDPGFFGFVGMVGFVTIGASALIVPRSASLAAWAEESLAFRWLPGTRSRPGDETAEEHRRGHVVIVGMNTLGRILIERFRELGEEVVAVDTDETKLEHLDVDTVAGDATAGAVMERADLSTARLVVSALQIEDVNSMIAYHCRALGVPSSIHAFDPTLVHELLEIGADHLMVSKLAGIPQMEAEIRRLGVEV